MISVADVIVTTHTVLAREAPKGQIVSVWGGVPTIIKAEAKAETSDEEDKDISSCMNVKTKRKDRGPLFETEWYRVILDEAHTIRNHKTATAKAVMALNGDLRWCLTGRLVYNKLDDIFTPLHFIGVVDRGTYRRKIVSIAKKNPELASGRAQVSATPRKDRKLSGRRTSARLRFVEPIAAELRGRRSLISRLKPSTSRNSTSANKRRPCTPRWSARIARFYSGGTKKVQSLVASLLWLS